MKRRTYVALLATLMSATAWGQEVSLYGTTMAQMWKAETPGFDKTTYTPATQYLGIDVVKLGSERLSLHLFGWGKTDLKESTNFDGSKSDGYLNFGYLQYRFDQANAEIKAGRFTINQSTGFEQVDGVSARTDLRGGFTVSAFAGKPVLYKTVDPTSQSDYDLQSNLIFGARLGLRLPKIGEIGLSYLADGTRTAPGLNGPSPVDYTRKQVGTDILIAPTSSFDFRGRTVFDVASHDDPAPGVDRSRIAEHDYTATYRFGGQFSASANYAERNYFAYFAGTNLPSLFRQDDRDKFKGEGLSLTWNTPWGIQAIADIRHTDRQTYGTTTRTGGELRWANAEKTAQVGAGGHFTNAAKTLLVDATAPSRSLTNAEARAWGMVTKGKLTGSLDAIVQKFKADNPYLAGIKTLHEVVASLGYQASTNIKVSGDVSHGSTPAAKNETRLLLRADYRFGFGKKGGQ
jgi:hypothetical protein